jgi:hypothetical protein
MRMAGVADQCFLRDRQHDHGMVGATSPPPSRADIEARFIALLDGSQSREEVDRWANEWMAGLDDVEVADEVWWALGILAGIDLRHGRDEPYLHDDAQLRSWLKEFRLRCARYS